MYCQKCGEQIDDSAVVCVHCGVPTNNFHSAMQSETPQKENNILAILGFVFSFFNPIAGLICSILGYRKSKKQGLELGGMALAGIIISSIIIGLAFIWVMFAFGSWIWYITY